MAIVMQSSLAQQGADSYSTPAMQSAAAEIQQALDSVARSALDAGREQTLQSLKLMLDMQPAHRHRFLLPRSLAAGRPGVEAVSKLFESRDAILAFRQKLGQYADALDDAAGVAESQTDWLHGYRLRWQACGVRSVLPAPTASKPLPQSLWPHSTALSQQQHTPKVFVNHPKSLWPAGSYSQVTTRHFEVASQAGTRPTAELAELCEQTFAVWKLMFFSVWADQQTVAPEYETGQQKKFTVILYRDRNAYVQALKGSEKNIGISTGYYDPTRNAAFFFWDGNKTAATVVHELTHQFFNEASSKNVALNTDEDAGFWVAEGVALYMESLSQQACGGASVIDIGGWDSPRLQAGRFRLLHNNYWVPWNRFHPASGKQFREGVDVAAWYSQACGLTHLWMDGTPWQRAVFVDYLESVYAGKADASILGAMNDNDALRDAYQQHLLGDPMASGARPFFANRKEVVLTRCEVSPQQLLDWPIGYRTQAWLDLSFTSVDDALFMDADDPVSPAWNVARLSVESTQVTDRSLVAFAGMKDLTELDLSNCKITDDGLIALKGNKTIKTLWLTQCDITDKSVDVLLTFSQLDTIDVAGTKISQAGWNRMLQARPKLKSKSTGP